MKKTVKRASFVLKDYENNDKKTKVEVSIGENGGLLICPEGYKDPVLLDFNEGKLCLYVWSNINSIQDIPTHIIDLSPALEKNRKSKN